MGYNTKQSDWDARYSAMTTKQIEALLKKAQEFVKKFPEHEFNSFHSEYIHSLKLKIAERIGKK
jgi:uncharacterized protein YgbK (DUF1537 family)